METVLQVTEMCKTFGGFSLDNVSFSIPEGCITGFIGANGAGKTTTLRAILGLTQRDSGSVQIFGMDAAAHAQEVKDRIGVVLDHGCFYEELTLQEMKSVVAPAYSTWREEDFRYYMERFALQPKQRIQTLSTGMKMKFALALALSHQAELLIMDEPTSGLDPLVRRQFLDLLREYMEKGGRGVLFSTHITLDLDKVADMLVMIDHGKILFQEEKDALLEKYRIVKGDRVMLTDAVRQKFMTLEETAFGFSGLTSHAEELMAAFPDLVVERPTIEDIMLGHIKGGVV